MCRCCRIVLCVSPLPHPRPLPHPAWVIIHSTAPWLLKFNSHDAFFNLLKMADRYFSNLMPDFVVETTPSPDHQKDTTTTTGTGDSLIKLLSMPFPSLSLRLQRAALDLKETILVETWGMNEQTVQDFTLYSGTLGTAFLLFKTYQLTNNTNDLKLCLQIVKACDSASLPSKDVTFICGRAGVCAIGAAAANYANDESLMNYYLNQFAVITLSRDHPDELLYGRSGFLWACFFINKHIGERTVPHTTIRAIASEIIRNGRSRGKKGGCPLMYEWYGERYWGAAHGLAGIMHVLMDTDLKVDEVEDVKGTLRYMVKNRFPGGNFPTSEEDSKRDVLVHWCHGAPGITLTLVKAAKVFGDDEFLQAAIDVAEVVWNRGLLKLVGICHGISGNTYVFLSLYQMTGNVEFLYSAKAFSCLLPDRAHKLIPKREMHGGDSPYSLFEGIGGMANLFLDMIDPSNARFPRYDL